MSEQRPCISIIIPTYNRAKYLKQTLSYYLKQRHIKEVIVVDDGSTDETPNLLRDVSQRFEGRLLKYERFDKKKNAAAARNRGLDVASGEFILLGEDDIIFNENYSYQLLHCLNKNRASLISGRIVYMKTGDSFQEALQEADNYTGPLIDKRLLYLFAWKKITDDTIMPFTHGCILFRRAILKHCRFDENYGGNGWRDETDFQLQATKRGYKIFICPHTVCFHLPRNNNDKGGQWDMDIFTFNGWAIKNNKYFLNKHYPHLKNILNLHYSKWQLMLFAFFDRLIFTIGYFTKMNK